MTGDSCKICRRLGTKLFLKGERCFSQKCTMIRRPYSPGQKKKKSRRTVSEYGKELREKQKLKNLYNLKETQFRKYVREILFSRKKTEKDASEQLFKILESRLDSVIFRLGIVSSRPQARQLVSHGHFSVNGRAVNIPSFQTKKGDIIKIKPRSLKKGIFQNLAARLKKQKAPSWLSWDFENMEAKIAGEPSLGESVLSVEIPIIFEYYSR